MLAFARRRSSSRSRSTCRTSCTAWPTCCSARSAHRSSIETRFPLSLPPARADANQLELALLNLAVNARDAMPEGGTIVDCAREDDRSQSRDRPVCPAAMSASGERQRRGHGRRDAGASRGAFFTTKGIGKGTGLGLSMVHGISEQSGGRFVLKSRKGEGTTAEIWLPAAAAGRSGPAAGACRGPAFR